MDLSKHSIANLKSVFDAESFYASVVRDYITLANSAIHSGDVSVSTIGGKLNTLLNSNTPAFRENPYKELDPTFIHTDKKNISNEFPFSCNRTQFLYPKNGKFPQSDNEKNLLKFVMNRSFPRLLTGPGVSGEFHPRKETISSTVLFQKSVPCIIISGEPRIILSEMKNIVLNKCSDDDLWKVVDELGTVITSPSSKELNFLQIDDALRRFSINKDIQLIRKSDAEFLCSKLLFHQFVTLQPGKGIITISCNCLSESTEGLLDSDAYTHPQALCVSCKECRLFLSLESFVSHGHKVNSNIVHWGFDPSHWREYINVSGNEDISHRVILDGVKAKFSESGNKRKIKMEDQTPDLESPPGKMRRLSGVSPLSDECSPDTPTRTYSRGSNILSSLLKVDGVNDSANLSQPSCGRWCKSNAEGNITNRSKATKPREKFAANFEMCNGDDSEEDNKDLHKGSSWGEDMLNLSMTGGGQHSDFAFMKYKLRRALHAAGGDISGAAERVCMMPSESPVQAKNESDASAVKNCRSSSVDVSSQQEITSDVASTDDKDAQKSPKYDGETHGNLFLAALSHVRILRSQLLHCALTPAPVPDCLLRFLIDLPISTKYADCPSSGSSFVCPTANTIESEALSKSSDKATSVVRTVAHNNFTNLPRNFSNSVRSCASMQISSASDINVADFASSRNGKSACEKFGGRLDRSTADCKKESFVTNLQRLMQPTAHSDRSFQENVKGNEFAIRDFMSIGMRDTGIDSLEAFARSKGFSDFFSYYSDFGVCTSSA